MNQKITHQQNNQREFNLDIVRREFPILAQTIHGKPLVYLDNAASAQRPQVVIDAVSHYYQTEHANVHRGAHTLGDRATASFEGARDKVQRFLNAPSREEIIWTRGTTEAINLIANGLAPQLKPGDEIITTEMEHHANIVPWQMLAERTGAILRAVALNAAGELDQSSYQSLLCERTKIVALGHVSNALGTINPIGTMIQQAKALGAITLIDGAQAVPHLIPDVQALDCDFYCFSAHKVFGPTGIGALYGRAELLNAMPPYQGGGEMIKQVSFSGTTYNELPYKFEAGTPAIAQAIGLGAALDYYTELNHQQLHAHETALLAAAMNQVANIPGMRVIGTAAEKVPVLSFMIDGLHPSDIGTLLDQQGIAIRTGHHCAMPLMANFGLPGTARASFAFYNTLAEVDQLFAALAKVQKLFAD